MNSRSGSVTSITSVSGGDRISMITSDSTQHHDVAEHDRQERQQRLDQPEVGRGARHELAGLQLVVAGEVEPLQPLVDRVAQVVLHVEAHPAADPAAHVGGDEGEDAGQHQQRRATARPAGSGARCRRR